MGRILIIEDDPSQQRVLRSCLQRLGHEVLCVARVDEGFAKIDAGEPFDLIILDRQLPDGEGLQVCRRLKRDPRTRLVPAIVLTTLKDFGEELQSYKSGADLFLPKPVDLTKLKGYVATLLDRTPYRGESSEALICGPLSLEPRERRVRVGAVVIDGLPEKPFALLYLLATRQGRMISRKVILQKLWGSTVRDKEVDVTVSRLRSALGPACAGLIRSIRGDGYGINLDFKPGSSETGS